MAKDSRNVKFVTILVVAAAAVGCRTARHNSNNIVFGRVAVQLSSRSVLYECIIGKNKLQHQQATAEFLVQKLTLFIGVALNMLFSYSNEIQSIVIIRLILSQKNNSNDCQFFEVLVIRYFKWEFIRSLKVSDCIFILLKNLDQHPFWQHFVLNIHAGITAMSIYLHLALYFS